MRIRHELYIESNWNGYKVDFWANCACLWGDGPLPDESECKRSFALHMVQVVQIENEDEDLYDRLFG